MTILFVTHYSGFYGANKSLYTLILLLQEKYGVQPLVLLPHNGPMCEQLFKSRIPFEVSHYYWWVNDNHGAFQWLLNKRKQVINYFRIPKLCRLFSKYKLDLIYTNSMCVNVGVLMAERLDTPHIWQARESISQFSLSLSLFLSRKIWMLPSNKCHILISNYMMNVYRNYFPNDRMVRIYNGIDLPKQVEERTKNNINARLKIACVGVLSEQKNQIELLKAQAMLRERGVDVETYFYGTGKESYVEQMRQYVVKNNLKDIAHIKGHIDDVFGALRDMNLGIVCAHDEAFGRTTIEFMLMHMPVVVSDSGANPELITQCMTGTIYPLGNIEKLSNAIEQYVKNPELLQTQGDEARKVAKREFSAVKNAELIYNEMRRAIDNSSKASSVTESPRLSSQACDVNLRD